jgi:hypothetical protein
MVVLADGFAPACQDFNGEQRCAAPPSAYDNSATRWGGVVQDSDPRQRVVLRIDAGRSA